MSGTHIVFLDMCKNVASSVWSPKSGEFCTRICTETFFPFGPYMLLMHYVLVNAPMCDPQGAHWISVYAFCRVCEDSHRAVIRWRAHLLLRSTSKFAWCLYCDVSILWLIDFVEHVFVLALLLYVYLYEDFPKYSYWSSWLTFEHALYFLLCATFFVTMILDNRAPMFCVKQLASESN